MEIYNVASTLPEDFGLRDYHKMSTRNCKRKLTMTVIDIRTMVTRFTPNTSLILILYFMSNNGGFQRRNLLRSVKPGLSVGWPQSNFKPGFASSFIQGAIYVF